MLAIVAAAAKNSYTACRYYSDMRGNIRQFFSLALVTVLMLWALASVPVRAATTFTDDTDELNCYLLKDTPTIDGQIAYHEWADAEFMKWWYEPISDHKDAYIYVYAKWDGSNYLYVMVDLCPDNSSEPEDYSMLYFDENHNNKFSWATPSATWEHYTDVERGGFFDDVRAFRAPASYQTDGTPICEFGFGNTDNVAWQHTIIEYKLALSYLNESSTMGFLVTGYGTLSPNYFSCPTAGPSNFTNNATVDDWTHLNLLNIVKPGNSFVSEETKSEIINLMIWVFIILIVLTLISIISTKIRGGDCHGH